ncbi:uncharacterized protein [Rutidosis leptorrhynchoides]|uniref:uncharacterized protein n=1 Tax=Rutidosis leptorrhynchoides TaxID=125765 RepID=UPI003A99C00F
MAELKALDIGNQTVEEYFRKVDSLSTVLCNLGSTLEEDDLATYAINGLNDKFPQASHIILHANPFPNLETVRSMMTLEEMGQRISTSHLPSLNVFRPTGQQPLSAQPTNTAQQLFPPQAHFAAIPQPNSSSHFLPQHNVTRSQVFSGPLQPTLNGSQPSFGSIPPGFSGTHAQNTYGHETIIPRAFSTTTLLDYSNTGWTMDTGASTHLTSSINNLSTIFNHCMYPSVVVGEGNSIPVTNTGHSILPNINRPLHLSNVLVTPNIVKNLIFVHRFTRDNKVSVSFAEFGFSVKDYLTRCLLL